METNSMDKPVGMAEKISLAGGILHFKWSAIGILRNLYTKKHSAKDKTAETKRMSSMNSGNPWDRVDSENEVGISFIKLQASELANNAKARASLLASINR